MDRESTQSTMSRVRPPRVHVTYEVETGGAIEIKELPFIVGVLADLSGDRSTENTPKALPERNFVEINRDNFDKVLSKIKPRLAFKVENSLQGSGLLSIEMQFEKLEDFEPQNVAEK